MVGNDGLSDGCPDSVDLSGDTSALNSDTDIKVGELVLSEDKNWFKNLQTHNLGLDILNGLAVDLDETPALFSKCNSSSRLFPVV